MQFPRIWAAALTSSLAYLLRDLLQMERVEEEIDMQYDRREQKPKLIPKKEPTKSKQQKQEEESKWVKEHNKKQQELLDKRKEKKKPGDGYKVNID